MLSKITLLINFLFLYKFSLSIFLYIYKLNISFKNIYKKIFNIKHLVLYIKNLCYTKFRLNLIRFIKQNIHEEYSFILFS